MMETTQSARCQQCDGMGQVKAVETRNTSGRNETVTGYVEESADWERVEKRTVKCRDCGNVWVARGGA